MEKCKVAVVIPYFGQGGAEHMVSRYVSNLDTKEMEIKMFCVLGEYLGNEMENSIMNKGIEISYVGKTLGFSFRAMAKLAKMLSAYKPDVVHTHLSALVYAAPWLVMHRRTKAFHTLHTVPVEENRRFLRKCISKLLIKSKRIVPIAISKTNRELISGYYRIPVEEIPVVNNSVETEKYFRKKREKVPFVFVTVGRMTGLKNHRLLMEAFSDVLKVYGNAVKLWIVGTGELENELMDYAEILEIQESVKFWGYRADVENILAESDVFVLSSDFEGLPLCLLEAMAAGLPIISTNVGGVSDIITDNGILIDCGNRKQLSDAMCLLKGNDVIWSRFSEAALKNVERFDTKYNSIQYEKIYQKTK